MTRSIASVALLATGLVVLDVEPAAACSCAEPRPPAQALEAADVVFEGSARSAELIVPDPSGTGMQRFRFSVARYYKGDLGPDLDVFSTTVCCICGRDYPLDEPYIVYARQSEDGRLVDSMCSSSHPLPFQEGESAALGEGVAPDPSIAVGDGRVPVSAAEPASGCTASLSGGNASGGGVLALLAAGALGAVCRRRARRIRS